MSKCIELVKSGVCERFFRRFASDFIPSANGYWAPVQLIDIDLLKLTKRSSTVLVTYSDSECQEISSLSYAESLLLNTKLRSGEVKLTVHYFGTSLNQLVKHAKAHLSQSAAVTCAQSVGFMLNFPSCIDLEAASTIITKEVTGGLRHLEVPSTAHLSSFVINRARLAVAKSNL